LDRAISSSAQSLSSHGTGATATDVLTLVSEDGMEDEEEGGKEEAEVVSLSFFFFFKSRPAVRGCIIGFGRLCN